MVTLARSIVLEAVRESTTVAVDLALTNKPGVVTAEISPSELFPESLTLISFPMLL